MYIHKRKNKKQTNERREKKRNHISKRTSLTCTASTATGENKCIHQNGNKHTRQHHSVDIARKDVFYPKSGDAQSVPYRLGQGVWLRNALFLLKWWDGWVKQNYANVANRSLPPATQPNNERQRFTLNRWNVTKPGVVSGFCARKRQYLKT